MEKNKKENRKTMLLLLFVLSLILIATGITYTVFIYSNSSINDNNTIKSGQVTMTYSEQSNSYVVDNALPKDDNEAIIEDNYFEFKVTSNVKTNITDTIGVQIPYEINMSKKPVALIIMDGFGYNPDTYGNAIAAAKKPNLDKYMAEWPNTIIGASGLNVGLPDGQMGNSEVGHTNIGAGRIVYQDLVKINMACASHTLLDNPQTKAAYEYAKNSGKALHFMGLCSHGGVHSSLNHLFEFLVHYNSSNKINL